MKLSQKAIQRMISGQVGIGGGGGSSLDPSMLAGMATQAWVEDGYISKAFWAELFIIHKKVTTVVMDGTTEISRTVDTSGVFTPNEIPETTSETDEETGYVTTVTTEINHIEFRKGAWSNSFISALGLNPSGGGGGGSSTLAGLLDVELTNPSNGQALIYDGNSSSPTFGKWINGTVQSGISMSDVWTALAAQDSTKQIDYSHISSAVSINNGTITIGTNTITPLTSLPADGYDNRYLKLAGGTMTGQIQMNSGGVWAAGSSKAIIKNTSQSGLDTYNTAFSCNALNGDWSMGTHGTEDALFAVYNPTGNTSYNNVVRVIFPTDNCTLLGTNTTYVSGGKGYINGTEITTISGSAGSTNRLTGDTPHTAWGRTYWSSGVPQNVSGNMSDVGNITPQSNATYSIGSKTNHFSTVHMSALEVWDDTTNEDFIIQWLTINNKRVACLYGWETVLSDIIIGGTMPEDALYFDSTNTRWGIGTTSPSYKLHVAGSIFGNSLYTNNNLASVSGGSIEGFHSIELNSLGSLSGYGGFIDFHYNGSSADYSARLIETNYGLVKLQSKGANGNDQRAALVVGEGYTSSYIQIGDIRLVCDSNHDLRVVMASGAAANLYATGGISALGMSAGTSSIDEMTFGYLNINNELNFGSSAKIYMDDFFYIDSDAHVSVNGVEFENNNAHANKLYLGNSQYLYVSGGTLYYYNGSSSKVIST